MEWVFWGLAVVCAGLVFLVLKIAITIWWKPVQVKKSFEAQGIRGPPYRLFYGNTTDVSRMIDEQNSKPMPLSHDILPRLLPHIHQWTKTYGQDFIFWFGSQATLVVPHPELIKEILSNKFGNFPKPSTDPLSRQLLGQGLAELKGEKWAQHRKIINPAFHMDLLKGMIPTIVKSSANMLDKWSKLVLSGASEVEVLKEFGDLTADVIALTAFGSSFTEGKQIFDMQDKQMTLVFESLRTVYIPGFRFLPTTKNRQRWTLEKEIRRSLRQVIDARKKTTGMGKTGSYGADLLGSMLSHNNEQVGVNAKTNASLSIEEIIDECKTFYFAGHESTSVLLTWSIILLGIHQDWQDRGRREVLEVCGRKNHPDADSLSRLKIGMIPTIVKSSANMLDKWSRLVLSGANELEVLKEFRDLTADVIARTAFGSSFTEGNHIFDMQAKQMILTSELFRTVYIPGFRFLPTTKNRQRWNLEKEIRSSLRQVINARAKTTGMAKTGRYGADLLGFMMSQNREQEGVNVKSNASLSTEEIIDECKTFYFAGHESTSLLLTWSIILLGIHQDWQERGRREVLEVCGRNNYPDADSLSRLKIVGMIINEALRLYPPAVSLTRHASQPMKLGRLSIPAGTQLMLPILAIHHDPALWGSDAKDFNPGRFSEGIAKAAKHPMAFMPFGIGPTICVGQNFALLEAKLVLAMILQKFSFVTSPSYTHAPMLLLTLRPQYGAQVIFHVD